MKKLILLSPIIFLNACSDADDIKEYLKCGLAIEEIIRLKDQSKITMQDSVIKKALNNYQHNLENYIFTERPSVAPSKILDLTREIAHEDFGVYNDFTERDEDAIEAIIDTYNDPFCKSLHKQDEIKN